MIALGMFVESLFGRPMRGLIAIERDLMRQSTLAHEGPPEEGLGRGDVPFGAQQEIDGLSLFVDGTIEIGPASFDFDVVSSTRQDRPARRPKRLQRFSNSGT